MGQTTSGFTLFLIISNLILVLGLVTSWIKAIKNSKEDPRLSKGLQLLQSKISVLEDLSDRTQSQTQKLNLQLDSKLKEVKELVEYLDKKSESLKLEAKDSSLENDELKNTFIVRFQKLESEIKSIENQLQSNPLQVQLLTQLEPAQASNEFKNSRLAMEKEKYSLAAEMIRQGYSALDIVKQLNLTVGEIQFISKLQGESSQQAENISFHASNHSASSFGSQIQKHLSTQTREMNKSDLQISEPNIINSTIRTKQKPRSSETVSVLKTNEIRPYIFKRME